MKKLKKRSSILDMARGKALAYKLSKLEKKFKRFKIKLPCQKMKQ